MLASWQELIFPQRQFCALCQRPVSRRNKIKLCDRCLSQLNFVQEPFCLSCGRPLRLASVDGGKCSLCREHCFHFTQARAVAVYEGFWRECIHMIKYCRRHDLVEPLVGLMAQVLVQCWQGTELLLVPVPAAPARKARRGYNQAELLALELGRQIKLPVENGILWLKEAKFMQSQLSSQSRAVNVRGAFAVHDPDAFVGKQVLLIDDILTTGWTASECARVLLGCGALRVDVLTLAVGAVQKAQLGLGKTTVRR